MADTIQDFETITSDLFFTQIDYITCLWIKSTEKEIYNNERNKRN